MKNKLNGLRLFNPWMHNEVVSLLNLSVTIRYVILTFSTCKRQSVSMTEWRVRISISLAWCKNVILSQLQHYVNSTSTLCELYSFHFSHISLCKTSTAITKAINESQSMHFQVVHIQCVNLWIVMVYVWPPDV